MSGRPDWRLRRSRVTWLWHTAGSRRSGHNGITVPRISAGTIPSEAQRAVRAIEHVSATRFLGSVQPEFRADRLEFRRLDESRMPYGHRVEQTVELACPEVEKLLKLREVRMQVVMLPDEVLQDIGVIGHAVKDVGGGQPKPLELAAEVGSGHAGSPDSQSAMVSFPTHFGNRWFRKNRAKSAC